MRQPNMSKFSLSATAAATWAADDRRGERGNSGTGGASCCSCLPHLLIAQMPPSLPPCCSLMLPHGFPLTQLFPPGFLSPGKTVSNLPQVASPLQCSHFYLVFISMVSSSSTTLSNHDGTWLSLLTLTFTMLARCLTSAIFFI